MAEIHSLNFTKFECERLSMWRYDTNILYDKEIVARLVFGTWSMTKSTLETAAGKWSLELGGALVNEYAVFEVASGEEIAIVEGGLSMSYDLRMRNTPDLKLTFKNKSMWTKTEYIWTDDKDHELIIFHVSMKWTGYNIVIDVNNALTEGMDTVFLMGLGLYILTHLQMTAAASGAI